MKLDPRKIQRLVKAAAQSSFFQRKINAQTGKGIFDLESLNEKVPVTTLEELVAEKITSGDPYSLRWSGKQPPLVVFQLDYDTESPLYLPLDRRALQSYAEALRRCWSLLGLKQGDAVAILDYGTSPISYLASSAFTPYLKYGAGEALGCLTVCNDGVTSMIPRAVEILKFVRPRIMFARAECLQPLASEIDRRFLRLRDYTQALVVSENEGVLSKAEQESFERRMGLPVYRLLRADAAMFFAMECPDCRLLHSWEDLYGLEIRSEGFAEFSDDRSDGYLIITNWFARFCPTLRYLSQVKAAPERTGCPRGPRDIRIAA